ncbi:SpoIIE family protein phosphatase [Streptomyces sp. NBC_01426]|uniref:ATP-binding protein n=1 Tax=Streptomyces sp. NBC_01426 TaxID=2975866 RepID=UPI002E3725ED|nr:ATP-binding protein [Streptomyces sp. NBC_01426]
MGPVTGVEGPRLLDCEDSAWFRDQPEAARGAAAALGRRIGLGEHRTAQLVLAVAELATNVTKYSSDGSMLLRVLRNEAVAGVEVVVVDGGPGMPDVAAALRDGVSTVGTLGIGLGAVQRLADRFDIHSVPGIGTVQLARFWPHPLHPSVTGEAVVGGITRPMGGEEVCGDAWAARVDTGERAARDTGVRDERAGRPSVSATALDWSAMTAARSTAPRPYGASHGSDRSARPAAGGRSALVHGAAAGPGRGLLVMSCDGLGHGPMAAIASQAAVQAFRSGTARTPEQVVEEVHRALRGTRGAAVAVARLEPDGRLLFCGIGNIGAAVVTADSRAGLLSHPGIVGNQMRQLRTYEHHMPAHGALIMHSDGLNERWKPGDVAPLLHHPPALIATGLLRHAGTRRDDASVVVAKGAW